MNRRMRAGAGRGLTGTQRNRGRMQADRHAKEPGAERR